MIDGPRARRPPRVRRRRQSPAHDLGLGRSGYSCPCASSWSPTISAAKCSAPSTIISCADSASRSPVCAPAQRAYLHSHMLGVLPEYRDSGAGRMLKLAQREDALARGFDLDRVDLRSARNQERLLQYRKARRHHPPLSAESLRHHHQPPARRTAHRPLRRRMASQPPAPGIDHARAHSRADRPRPPPPHRSRAK